MAYVFAKKRLQEICPIAESRRSGLKTVIQPISDADGDWSAIYEALDDPRADWSKAVTAMLNGGPIEFTGEQAIERIKFVQSLEHDLTQDEGEKQNDEGREPGIGNRG